MEASSSLDRDLEAAKTAWSDSEIADVKASMDAANTTPREFSVGGLGQSSPPDAVPKAYLALKKFWSKYGERFSRVWAGVDQVVRERVLHIFSGGTMPRWPQDVDACGPGSSFGICILCPVINVRELSHPKTGIPKMIKTMIDQDLFLIYCEAGNYVRNLMEAGYLKQEGTDMPVRHSFTMVNSENLADHKSYIMTGEAGRNIRFLPSVQKLIDTGNAYEGPVFYHLIQKVFQEFSVCLAVVDEFHTSVFNHKSIMMKSVSSCSSCGATAEDGVVSLKSCVECRRACYCSKACQKSDWSKHKKDCMVFRKHVEAALAAATGAATTDGAAYVAESPTDTATVAIQGSSSSFSVGDNLKAKAHR